MKKLSLLIALCMIISIGGVYATWIYADGSAPQATGDMSIGLADLGSSTTKGEFFVDVDSTKISVDQTDTANYLAKLVCEGDVTITFKPNDSWLAANPTVNTFNVTWALSAQDTAYTVQTSDGEVSLFSSFDTSAQSLALAKSGDVFTATIPAATWSALMTLSEFHLTTKAAYQACNVAGFGDITLTVNEGTN